MKSGNNNSGYKAQMYVLIFRTKILGSSPFGIIGKYGDGDLIPSMKHLIGFNLFRMDNGEFIYTWAFFLIRYIGHRNNF